MDKKLPAAWLIVASGFLAFSSQPQNVKNHQEEEQTEFSMEDSTLDNPISTPDKILEFLRRDPRVTQCLATQRLSTQDVSADWFLTSEIHLHRSSETDYVVLPHHICISGVNITPFWIFRDTPNGLNLILRAAAHDLTIEQETSNGYKNIRTGIATASIGTITTYKFDGSEYKLYRTKSSPIE
jgi:hypothetical protein